MSSLQQPLIEEFAIGDWVRVMAAESWGHCRTPDYLRGQVGCIRKLHGYYRNPESLAYGGSGLPKLPLYQVEFAHATVWTIDRTLTAAPDLDTLWVDIYHHWLERSSAPSHLSSPHAE